MYLVHFNRLSSE